MLKNYFLLRLNQDPSIKKIAAIIRNKQITLAIKDTAAGITITAPMGYLSISPLKSSKNDLFIQGDIVDYMQLIENRSMEGMLAGNFYLEGSTSIMKNLIDAQLSINASLQESLSSFPFWLVKQTIRPFSRYFE